MNSLGDVKEKSAKISINYNIWKWEGTVLFFLLLQFSLSWLHFPTQNLLSYAKVAEDRVEHLVGRCAAANLRQGVGGVAQVEAQYLGGLSLKQFAPHLLDL